MRVPVSLPHLLAVPAFALLVTFAYAVLDDGALLRVVHFLFTRRDAPDPFFAKTLGFAATYLTGAFGLAALYCHANPWIRRFAYGFSALTVALHLAVKQVDPRGFTYHDASLLFGEPEQLGQALVAFLADAQLAIVFAAALFVGLSWSASRFVPRLSGVLPLLAAALAIPMSSYVITRTTGNIYELPIPYRVPMVTAFAQSWLVPYYGKRAEPFFPPTREPLADHIVLMVEESVRADYLGINNPAESTTPFLDASPDRFFNYGIASSTGNLSRTSNILIQSGLRPDQLPDDDLRSLKNPNVFSYMQKAGFRSYFVDSQIRSDRAPNHMTGFDLAKLDAHLQVRRLEVGAEQYEIDHRMVRHLKNIVLENERSFAYVLKTGAHFHYENMYPPGRRVFAPTLAAGEPNVDPERTRNSYRNAVSWTVDDFFEQLVEAYESTGKRVLLIYTSDHGQSLLELHDGQPMRRMHGTAIDPPIEQAMVPLMLFPFGHTKEGDTKLEIARRFDPALVNRVSAFEIFPTALEVAGYDYADIRKHYGYSLFDVDAPRERRVFVSGDLYNIGDVWRVNEFELPEGLLAPKAALRSQSGHE